MRTTLTIDDDVAAAIDTLRQARRVTLRRLVNDALRRGLAEMGKASEPNRKPFQTRSFDVGEVLVGSIDNVADALAASEGETFR